MSKVLKEVQNGLTHLYLLLFNIKAKSFGKLRLIICRACWFKGYANGMTWKALSLSFSKLFADSKSVEIKEVHEHKMFTLKSHMHYRILPFANVPVSTEITNSKMNHEHLHYNCHIGIILESWICQEASVVPLFIFGRSQLASNFNCHM